MADSWSVVSMVDEPLELVCAFVAHYRALGAAEITLCLDRPRPEILDVLGAADGVRLIVCDDAWWGGKRPVESVHRQMSNANRVYADCCSDWLLHVDADEYLWIEGDVGDRLAELGGDWPAVRVWPAERVRDAEAPGEGLFDGRFRLPRQLSPARLAELHGADAAFFNQRGLVAHARGKCLTRTGLPMRIGVHQPFLPEILERPTAERISWLNAIAADMDGWLAHYDGMTQLHWTLKLLGRLENRRRVLAAGRQLPPNRNSMARIAQMQEVEALCGDPVALAAFAARLLLVTPQQRARLERAGLLRTLGLDPAAAAQEQFPGLGLDFTVSGFDAKLRQERSAMIEAAGLSG